MRLKGNDESFMRVVVWGQDETNLPPVISHLAAFILYKHVYL